MIRAGQFHVCGVFAAMDARAPRARAVYKHVAKTPELNTGLNMLDLGMLVVPPPSPCARQAQRVPRVPQNCSRWSSSSLLQLWYCREIVVLKELWVVIEEKFWCIDSEVLNVIAKHKLDIVTHIKAICRAKIKKEAHGNARKRTKDDIAAAKAP